MKFEQIIKKISAIVAGIIVFLLAGGFYLQLKGFEPDQEKGFVLTKAANAAETDKSAKTIPMNYAFPDDHVLGKASAPVTLYEYSSFGCFHCADFHLLVLPELQKEFVLLPSFTSKGKKYRAIKYVCDFYLVYSDGSTAVIDVKGMPDQKSGIKKKMFIYNTFCNICPVSH